MLQNLKGWGGYQEKADERKWGQGPRSSTAHQHLPWSYTHQSLSGVEQMAGQGHCKATRQEASVASSQKAMGTKKWPQL